MHTVRAGGRRAAGTGWDTSMPFSAQTGDVAARPAAGTGASSLTAPTLDDARVALARVSSTAGPEVWTGLLARAGLSGHERGREPLERLLTVMAGSGDPVTALCARALRIRATASDRLAAAQHVAVGPA